MSSEGSIEERVKFTGKDYDEAAGLYYFNARWYDAELGRFTTEDPARDGLNWYVYVRNNPLRFVDPTGLESADAADRQYTYFERDIGEKIKDLGRYGDPRTRNGAILTNTNGPPSIKIRRYEDFRGIEGLSENLSQLDSHENSYGKTGMMSGPNIIESITNFRKGNAFLVTYDNPKSEGLDGYEVFLIDRPDADTGLYPKYPQGESLSPEQAQKVLESRPNLVDSAISEDLRPWYRKVLDWIF